MLGGAVKSRRTVLLCGGGLDVYMCVHFLPFRWGHSCNFLIVIVIIVSFPVSAKITHVFLWETCFFSSHVSQIFENPEKSEANFVCVCMCVSVCASVYVFARSCVCMCVCVCVSLSE